MRIVLDTNILVSALLSRVGPSGQILAGVRSRKHLLITSPLQIAEFRRAIGSQRLRTRIPPEDADNLGHTLAAIGIVVSELPAVNVSPDPHDNAILAMAIAGNADLIVSGDKQHVLSLESVEGIPIVSPRDALSRLAI